MAARKALSYGERAARRAATETARKRRQTAAAIARSRARRERLSAIPAAKRTAREKAELAHLRRVQPTPREAERTRERVERQKYRIGGSGGLSEIEAYRSTLDDMARVVFDNMPREDHALQASIAKRYPNISYTELRSLPDPYARSPFRKTLWTLTYMSQIRGVRPRFFPRESGR